jgi:hypothetical protein
MWTRGHLVWKLATFILFCFPSFLSLLVHYLYIFYIFLYFSLFFYIFLYFLYYLFIFYLFIFFLDTNQSESLQQIAYFPITRSQIHQILPFLLKGFTPTQPPIILIQTESSSSSFDSILSIINYGMNGDVVDYCFCLLLLFWLFVMSLLGS